MACVEQELLRFLAGFKKKLNMCHTSTNEGRNLKQISNSSLKRWRSRTQRSKAVSMFRLAAGGGFQNQTLFAFSVACNTKCILCCGESKLRSSDTSCFLCTNKHKKMRTERMNMVK